MMSGIKCLDVHKSYFCIDLEIEIKMNGNLFLYIKLALSLLCIKFQLFKLKGLLKVLQKFKKYSDP